MTAARPDPRAALLQAVTAAGEWDIIVIGGGASGLGVALEAVTRGYKTLLLEAVDYAAGTSSRSTKLMHGGVRYLAQGQFRFLLESLKERDLLLKNAPHLVHELPFLIAVYQWWRVPIYWAGLKLYDLLAGKRNLRTSRFLTRAQTLARSPTLKAKGLKGGILYFDGQFDDSRLAITLLRTFQDEGGVALNAVPVTSLIKQNGKTAGVRFVDSETGVAYEAQGNVVINATGVFADSVRQMDNPDAPAMLSPSQGTHLVLPERFLPGGTAILVPKTEDGRVLFILPWQGRTLIGTTDTAVMEITPDPIPLAAEIDFLLRTASAYLDPAPKREDILSLFAGLRPLVTSSAAAETKALSREHVVLQSESRLVTLTGGKWTTYRRMGQDTLERVEKFFAWSPRPSRTAELKLHDWTETPEDGHWAAYGTDAAQVQALPGATNRLHPNLPYTEAEIRWAVRQEQARTLPDMLARRTHALLLDASASLAIAPKVAVIMAEELGRDKVWQQRQVADFTALVGDYCIS